MPLTPPRALHPPFRPLGASTNGRLENTPLSSDATAIESAVLVVVSFTGKPAHKERGGETAWPSSSGLQPLQTCHTTMLKSTLEPLSLGIHCLAQRWRGVHQRVSPTSPPRGLAHPASSAPPTCCAENLWIEHEDVGDGQEGGQPGPQLNGDGAAALRDAEVPVQRVSRAACQGGMQCEMWVRD